MRFLTSHSRFALASIRNRGKNEVLGEEAELAVNFKFRVVLNELLLSLVISLPLFFHSINVTLFPQVLIKKTEEHLTVTGFFYTKMTS